MSILFLLEGFDWCSSFQLTRAPLWISGDGGLQMGAGRTRNGWGVGCQATVVNAMGTGFQQFTAGVASYYNQSPGQGTQGIITFNGNSSTQSGITLQGYGNGQLIVVARSNNSFVGSAPSTFIVKPNIFYYYEFQVLEETINVAPSGGMGPYWYQLFTYSVYINGASQGGSPIMSGVLQTPNTSGVVDTSATLFNSFQVFPGQDGVMDDVYLTDDTFLGNITVTTCFPNADGIENDFTPDPVQANWMNVNEHNPGQDDDATFNYAASAGMKDYYKLDQIVPFTPPPMTTGISGIYGMVIFRSSDTGTATVSGLINIGGTEGSFPGSPFPAGDNYIGLGGGYLTDFGGAALTQTGVNNIQIGIERNG